MSAATNPERDPRLRDARKVRRDREAIPDRERAAVLGAHASGVAQDDIAIALGRRRQYVSRIVNGHIGSGERPEGTADTQP